MGNLLGNKNILVMGVRNKWSIAWGIVKAVQEEGANVIITYQSEREKEGAEQLVPIPYFSATYLPTRNKQPLCRHQRKYGVLHGLVHSIAHAKTEDLQNDFIYTSREGFAHAMNISAYSLVAVSRGAKELMTEGGSIITLTYMGSERYSKDIM